MKVVDVALDEEFRAAVAKQFGLYFEDAKLEFLGQLLRRRASACNLSQAEYLTHLRANTVEAGLLIEELTVGETYFFRNNDQFRALAELVLPERMAQNEPDRRLCLLSAGCSSGEEAYTLAMLINDTVPRPAWDVTIHAIDLNPAVLRKARSGRYSQWALRETSPAARRRWFVQSGREMVLNSDLREMVSFEQDNLADPRSEIWRRSAYDVIFCRNVLMYLTPATQRAVIERIAASLVPGGFLFLGHAETLRGLSNAFHLKHTHGTFYYQLRDAAEPRPDFQIVPVAPASSIGTTSAAPDADWYEAINAATRRIESLTREPAAPAPKAAPPPAPWNLEAVLDLLQRERFSEALTLIGTMPEEARQDSDVLLLHALLLVQDGKLSAAADVSRILLAQDDLNAAANYVLALCHEGAGNNSEAIPLYDRASYLDPTFAMPRLRRGLIARRVGRTADAARDLTEALDLLKREETSRLLLFGGGFTRTALSRLCESELKACTQP